MWDLSAPVRGGASSAISIPHPDELVKDHPASRNDFFIAVFVVKSPAAVCFGSKELIDLVRLDDAPYRLVEEGGRLWLFVNERVPPDVTDLIGAGYPFRYTDADGAAHTATITRSVHAYPVA